MDTLTSLAVWVIIVFVCTPLSMIVVEMWRQRRQRQQRADNLRLTVEQKIRRELKPGGRIHQAIREQAQNGKR